MSAPWLLDRLSGLLSVTGLICCTRSATTSLIVRQRGIISELTNAIPSAVTAVELLEDKFSTHLPPDDNIYTTLSSPQFGQALSMFWSALQSGQAAPVVRQFGLGDETVNAAASGNLEEFVSALENETKEKTGQSGATQPSPSADEDKNKKQPPSTGGTAGKKDDDDEGMALD